MRDIEVVLESHVASLMAAPGVVGAGIGALEDGSPCILVFVADKGTVDCNRLPQELDGYRVLIQETGEIRAMPEDAPE